MNFNTHLRTFLSEEQATKLETALQQEPVFSVRLHPKKIPDDQFLQRIGDLIPHPFVRHAYYYDKKVQRLGAHPWHWGGAFYLQEPAAMMVGEYVPLSDCPQLIVDLAAAPGGKTLHVASRMAPGSVLIAHEYDYERSSVLADNVARWGSSHLVVTTGEPDLLLTTLRDTVDVIILDAPCSGEGMFRKLSFAETDWSLGKVESCARIQTSLVDTAVALLKKGGILMYSTCTFNPHENEKIIEHLLARGDMELVALPEFPHLSRGIHHPETVRLFPHEFAGEGHFMAVCRKTSGIEQTPRSFKGHPLSPQLIRKLQNQFPIRLDGGTWMVHQTLIYWIPAMTPELPSKLGLRRTGLHLGEFKGDDFIPDHALALAEDSVIDVPRLHLAYEDPRVGLFLKGESFRIEESITGWTIVTCEGIPLGWGKVTHHQLKNKLPKEWRHK